MYRYKIAETRDPEKSSTIGLQISTFLSWHGTSTITLQLWSLSFVFQHPPISGFVSIGLPRVFPYYTIDGKNGLKYCVNECPLGW